jgi:hypothetical protein
MTQPEDRQARGLTGRRSFRVRASSAATPAEIWPLVGEARRWKEWSFLDRSDLIAEGEPAPDGVGAVRRFTSHGVGSQEEVVAWDPPHHLAYSILKGFPVRHYRGDVHLDPEGVGTAITWSATFDEMVPGTGRVMELVLQSVIKRFVKGLTLYADQQRAVAADESR